MSNMNVATRKKAAKPRTPDELATRQVKAQRVENALDPVNLRNATGSTASIHLFRAIRALPEKDIPIILHMLNSESRIRAATKGRFQLMQPVYILVDGQGGYINDYCLAHIIDATEEIVTVINAKGTFTAKFPNTSTSILTVEEFDASKPDLKPASEKPVRRSVAPIMGNSDYEPPTINDLMEADRVKPSKMARSDLHSLFTSFSEGSKLADGTLHKSEKKAKKVKAKAVAETSVELPTKTPKTPKKPKKLVADAAPQEEVTPKLASDPGFKIKVVLLPGAKIIKRKPEAKICSALASLDFSGYETAPGEELPEVVKTSRASKETSATKKAVTKVSLPSKKKLSSISDAVEEKSRKPKSKLKIVTSDSVSDAAKPVKPTKPAKPAKPKAKNTEVETTVKVAKKQPKVQKLQELAGADESKRTAKALMQSILRMK